MWCVAECVNVCDVMCEWVAYGCECVNVCGMCVVCGCKHATCVNMCDVMCECVVVSVQVCAGCVWWVGVNMLPG